ncbi:hypothetical protein [Nocardia nepalensis]|uniref:hypothetical protein n=1 Tax=Nocardia nepalensis TaxID=3375448 RepID=UPI003B67532D
MADQLLPDDLFAAIGRVAAASARLEEAIRDIAIDHADTGLGHGSVIFEGQSMDWLISNGVAVIDSELSVPSLVEREPETYSALLELRELTKSASALKNDRNIVVHGVWRAKCWLADYDEADFEDGGLPRCTPRSSRSRRNDEPLFHVNRSRYRQVFGQEQAWTVSDVLAVASTTNSYIERLVGAQRAYKAAFASDFERRRG